MCENPTIEIVVKVQKDKHGNITGAEIKTEKGNTVKLGVTSPQSVPFHSNLVSPESGLAKNMLTRRHD